MGGGIDPFILVELVRLADINDKPLYDANVATEEAAWEEAQTEDGEGQTQVLSPQEDEGGGILSLMDSSSCAITNLTQPFTITQIQQDTNRFISIAWQSCPVFRYLAFSADEFSTNTSWLSRAYVWGQTNAAATTWTDTATTNAPHRFYKVQRILSNPIAAGTLHSLAVRPDGTVWAWGDNGCGRLGNGEGGNFISPTPSSIVDVSNAISVAAGSLHALALRADGKVSAWEDDSYGQLGVGGLASGQTNLPIQSILPTQTVAIAAGGYYSIALDKDGAVWTWGAGGSGQLGNGGTTNLTVPTLPTNLSSVVAIAAGYDHAIALAADKTVWTWGNNNSGQFGDGTTTERLTPVSVSGLSNVVAIAGGYSFTLAATSSGDVYAWGDNGYGQLGTNGLGSINHPIRVAGISNAVLVSTGPASVDDGSAHSLAVTVDQGARQYWAWGRNGSGQVGNGTTVDQYAPVLLQFYNRCGPCIQLGTNGQFAAQSSGTLILYFNNDVPSDNSTNAYTVTVSGLGQTNVPGNAANGVVIGIVTNGGTYIYSASGWCSPCNGCGPTYEYNADGYDHSNNVPPCATNGYQPTNAPCPDARCYSLVGKIE
ncbi:MAG TPA: hypothetical protein VL486_05850 [Verrucomicrobiae bacterium]|nr:hypothetical protein [Verrucomicrobiae bacterium]